MVLLNHLRVLLKCRWLGPTASVSDSAGLGEALESAFLTSSQVNH